MNIKVNTNSIDITIDNTNLFKFYRTSDNYGRIILAH